MHPIELIGLSLALLFMAVLPKPERTDGHVGHTGAWIPLRCLSQLGHCGQRGYLADTGVVRLAADYPLLEEHWLIVRSIATFFLVYLDMGLLWQRQNKTIQSASADYQSNWQGFIAGLMLTLAAFKANSFYLAIFPAFVELSPDPVRYVYSADDYHRQRRDKQTGLCDGST